MREHASVGLYVHIPFCTRICHYCDFACYAGQESHIDRYLDALLREVGQYPRGLPVRTLYLGGGTPSVLAPEQLERLVTGLRTHLDLSSIEEATLEVNPRTGSIALWECARKLGFDRFSVGVQSFDPDLLQALGRDHAVQDVYRTLADLRDSGARAISLDLMYGLPGQTLVSWEATLEAALSLNPQHMSVYGLILEERTAFGRWHRQGRLDLPEEELEMEMGDRLVACMQGAGLERYEIGSFARAGHESRHNSIYWSLDPYIGLGSGAHSFWQGRRYENPRGLTPYMTDPRPGFELASPLSDRELQEEVAFLGLRRTREGLDRERFRIRTGFALDEAFPGVVDRLQALGLVQDLGDRIALTHRGCWLSNEVFSAFLG